MQMAPDFIPIDTSTVPYSIDEKLLFVPYFKSDKQDYTLQRITGSGKAHPENVKGVKETEIIGTSNNLFDNTFSLFIQGLHNKIIVYNTSRNIEKNMKI